MKKNEQIKKELENAKKISSLINVPIMIYNTNYYNFSIAVENDKIFVRTNLQSLEELEERLSESQKELENMKKELEKEFEVSLI